MTTYNEKAKSQFGYRLLALIVVAACVGLFFVPVHFMTFANPAEVKLWEVVKKIIVDFSELTKWFGFLPAFNEKNLFGYLFTATQYFLIVGAVVSAVLALVAIFKKKPANLLRGALVLLTLAVGAYAAVEVSYLFVCDVFDVEYLDKYILAFLAGCALLCILVSACRNGKAVIMNTVQLFLSLAFTAALVLAFAWKFDMVDLNLEANKILYKSGEDAFRYEFVLLGIAGWAIVNLIMSACRFMSKKGLVGDIVRYVFNVIVALGFGAFYFLFEAEVKSYLLFSIIAASIALVQVVLACIRLAKNKKAATVATAVPVQESAPEVCACKYEGSPVAGVAMAESTGELSPEDKISKADAEKGLDAFMLTLTQSERTEFIDLYILQCKGAMPEIPAYKIGENNKDFFNKVFIYLGRYRNKVSNGLMAKIYDYAVKL